MAACTKWTWCVLSIFCTFVQHVIGPSIGTTLENDVTEEPANSVSVGDTGPRLSLQATYSIIEEGTTSGDIESSPAQATEDPSSGNLFDWKSLLIGLLALLNGLALLQLCVRCCCNTLCIKNLERFGRYRCLYILKSIGCLIYEKPSISITNCSRLSSSTIIVEVKCPGFSDANKVQIKYFYDGKRIGKSSFLATDTKHKLHYDSLDDWNGFIVAKAKDTYGHTAECQFLIPDVLNLQWWQEKLTQTYQKLRRRLTFLAAPSESTDDDLFKELSFEGKRGDRDLFSIKDSSNKTCKNVLLIGRSGIGKTTLMNQLAYLWSNEIGTEESVGNSTQLKKHVLKRFKLVFLLNFQDIKEGHDLCQTIQDQLTDYVSQEVMDDLPDTIKRLGSECLFLFHGYDKTSNQRPKTNFHLLNSPYLNNCFIVVTCKPHYVQEFREKWKKGMECVHIVGFDDNTRMSYIQSFMHRFCPLDENKNNDTANSVQGLEDNIKNSPLLNALSRIPIFLSMMCVIWEKAVSVPDNIAGLYCSAIDIVCKNCKESGLIKDDVDVSTILKGLGKFALEGFLEGTLWFEVDELKVDSDILQKGRILGVIFVETRDAGLKKGQCACIRFVHRTWQEFCAAFYLDSLKKKKDFKIYLDKIDRNNIDEMELLLRFSCGLSFGAAQMIMTHVAALSLETIKEQQRQRRVLAPLGELADDGVSEKSFDVNGSADGVSVETRGLLGLGSDNDPWRLPILLLSEVESQGIEPLSEKQIDIIYNILQPLFVAVNINLGSQDNEYLAILDNDNLKWPRLVKSVGVLWKQRQASIEQFTSVTMKLVQSMTRVTSLEILPHPLHLKSYCTDLIRAVMGKIKNLEHFSCHVPFDHTLMAQFLDQQHLKSFKLGSHRDITFNCTYLFRKITRLQTLQKLDCSLPCDLRTLGIFLAKQDNMRRITINPEDVLDSTKFLKVVTKENKMAKRLEEIKLSNLSCENAELMATFVSLNTAMRTLVLKHCTSNQSTLKSSQSTKSLCQSIHTFCLDNCSSNIVEAVTPAIGVATLTELRIENIQDMNEVCSEKLFTRMKEVGKQKKGLPLRILSMSGTRVGKAVIALAQVFAFTKHLDMLDMTNTELPYREIHDFLEQLLQVPSLEKLYLRGINVGSGLKKTFVTLSNRTKGLRLRILDLSSCELSDQNSDILAAVFANAAYLQELDISDNLLGNSLHKVFSQELQLSQLEKLNLNNVGLSQAAEPTQWLNRQSFPLLARVALQGNAVSAEEVQIIAKKFQNKLDILTGKSHIIVDLNDDNDISE